MCDRWRHQSSRNGNCIRKMVVPTRHYCFGVTPLPCSRPNLHFLRNWWEKGSICWPFIIMELFSSMEKNKKGEGGGSVKKNEENWNLAWINIRYGSKTINNSWWCLRQPEISFFFWFFLSKVCERKFRIIWNGFERETKKKSLYTIHEG